MAIDSCPPTDDDPNGEWRCEWINDVEQKCQKSCESGYEMKEDQKKKKKDAIWCANGTAVWVPTQDGPIGNHSTWISTTPKCGKVECPELEVADDTSGDWSCSHGNVFQSVCTLSCSEGFASSTGKRIMRECGADGEWRPVDMAEDEEVIVKGAQAGVAENCVEVTCAPILLPRTRHINCTNGNNYGSFCLISCPLGFTKDKPIVTECLKTGSWSKYDDECRLIESSTKKSRQEKDATIGLGFVIAVVVLLVVIIAIIYCRNKNKIDSTVLYFVRGYSRGDRMEIVDHDELENP